MEENNERFWVERFKDSDSNAFSVLYLRYHKAIYFFSLRYLKDPNWAADAMQSLFLSLWEERRKIDPKQPFMGYVFTVLRNQLLDMLKHQAVVESKHAELFRDLPRETESFVRQIEDEERSRNLRLAMLKLSPQKQRICHLKIEQGLSNAEIAEQLGVSINTVKVQYTQIVKELRKHLEAEFVWFILLFLTL